MLVAKALGGSFKLVTLVPKPVREMTCTLTTLHQAGVSSHTQHCITMSTEARTNLCQSKLGHVTRSILLCVWLVQSHRLCSHISTPCFIKKTTRYLIAHNFGKCWPIFVFYEAQCIDDTMYTHTHTHSQPLTVTQQQLSIYSKYCNVIQ